MATQYIQYPTVTNATATSDVNLVEVGGAAISLGQKTAAASLPVVLASNQPAIVTTDAADGLTGAAVPASAVYLGANVAGNLTGLAATANGLKVDGSASTQPVSGTVTANQGGAPWADNITQVGGAALALGQTTMAASLPMAIASNQSAIPENLSQVGGSAIAIGQAAMAASLPVVIASNQSTINTQDSADGATGGAVPATAIYLGASVAGTLTGLVATANGLKVDGSASTQPISGTVTANQGGAPWSQNITQVAGSALALGQTTMSASLPMAIASNQSAIPENLTQVGGSSIALGQTTMSASLPMAIASNQSAIPENLTQVGGSSIALGQTTMSASLPVTFASNQSTIAVTPAPATGRTKVNIVRNVYSSVNVTTAAYVQLVASTAATINLLDIFDSSGQTLVFAVGAAASEVDQFNIYPGGNGRIELAIPSGSRLSIKAVSATANVGELDINCFS